MVRLHRQSSQVGALGCRRLHNTRAPRYVGMVGAPQAATGPSAGAASSTDGTRLLYRSVVVGVPVPQSLLDRRERVAGISLRESRRQPKVTRSCR